MSLKTSSSMEGVDTLDRVLQKTEFENSQQTKAIQTERERTRAFTQQANECMQNIKQLEDSIATLDEQAKKLHKGFKSSRDNAESLRHTLSVLEQHADALHEKIQASVQKTHQQKTVHSQELNKYKAIWSGYEEKYASSANAKLLATLMGELNVATETSSSLHDEVEQLKQCLAQLQSKSHQQDWIAKVVQIAAVRVETQSIMVSTKQNWSDIAVSKNAILNLMKKVEEKKTEFAKKELEPQPVKSVQSKSTEVIATPISAGNTQQNSVSSIIKFPTKSIFLCATSDGNESGSSTREIPKTPRASVRAEIRQLILPPITPIRNKGTFRMGREIVCESSHQIDQNCNQTRASHRNFLVPQVRHKQVFPAPESTRAATTPDAHATGPDNPHSYTLSVPSRPKSLQSINNSHAEIVSNPNRVKASSIFKSIEGNASSLDRDTQSLDLGMDSNSMENYSNPNTIYAANPNSHETYAMNINSSGNGMDTTNNVANQNYTDSLQLASAVGTSSGSWFDNWGIENNTVHPDQQGVFPPNLSSTEANSGIFCDGFLNKGSEDSGFPFLAAQENSATESFFCESARASTLPESNTGFGLSYPFMLQSSETPATSMFTF